MALIVEDGSGADPTANSYVSRNDIIAYAVARGVTLPADDTTDVFGIKAMDFLDLQDWIGVRLNPHGKDDPAVLQALDWPRNLEPAHGHGFGFLGSAYGSGLAYNWADCGIDVGLGADGDTPIVGTIPNEVKLAQCYLAVLASTGFVLVPTIAGGGSASSKFVTFQKLGPLEKHFSEAVALKVNSLPFIPAVSAMLKGLTKQAGPSRTYRV